MPRTPSQNKAIKDARREQLLTIAQRFFAASTYSEVSIDKLTKAAECSHGLFYHYFPNKEAVFSALVKEKILPSDGLPPFSEAAALGGIEGLRQLCSFYGNTGEIPAKSFQIVRICTFYPEDKTVEEHFPKFAKSLALTPLLTRLVKEGQKEGLVVSGSVREIVFGIKTLFQAAVERPGSLHEDVLFGFLRKN